MLEKSVFNSGSNQVQFWLKSSSILVQIKFNSGSIKFNSGSNQSFYIHRLKKLPVTIMVRSLARCNFSITGLVSLLMRFSNTINPNRVRFFSTSCLSNLSILMSLVFDGRSLIAKAMGKNIQINYFLLILQEMALVLYFLSCK